MNVVIIGATSAIGQATARKFAASGATFYLVGRSPEKLMAVAQDLTARGAKDVVVDAVDLSDLPALPALATRIEQRSSPIDVAILAHGVLGDQARAQTDFAEVEELFRTNFLSYVALLTPLANLFERQR